MFWPRPDDLCLDGGPRAIAERDHDHDREYTDDDAQAR